MDKENIWIYREKNLDKDAIENLSKQLNISKYSSILLLERNIDTYDKAFNFFRPSFDNLHNSDLLNEIHEAVNIIHEYKGHNILIYGDYDVDGVTSIAMVYDFFKNHISYNTFYYVPDRFSEGYGLSDKVIDYSRQNNIELIITFDCGTKDYEVIEKIKQEGICVIVTDHHEVDENRKNPANAFINPKRLDSTYPFNELSGCGVGFKLLQSVCKNENISPTVLDNYVDLLTLSIACDLVPLIDENRIFMHYGLKKINKNPSPVMSILLSTLNITHVDVETLVFRIGPLINAAGRITNASIAVDLLISEDQIASRSLIDQIMKLNKNRKDVHMDMTNESIKMINESDDNKNANLLYKKGWNIGILGIVASKCVEQNNKPTIIMTNKDDYIVGSARSVDGINIYNILTNCSEYLLRYGGHSFAAGITLSHDNLINFCNKFEEELTKVIDTETLIPKIYIDLQIPLHKITKNFLSIVNQMGPFGNQNMSPVLESEVYIVDIIHFKGKNVLLIVKDDKSQNFEIIGFNMSEKISEINNNKPVKVVYSIKCNKSNQYILKDIKSLLK